MQSAKAFSFFLFMTAFVVTDSGAAIAADLTPEQKLQEIERAQGDARARAKTQAEDLVRLNKDITAAQIDVIAAAGRLRETETAIISAEGRLVELNRKTREIQSDLKTRHGELAQTLSALAAIARTPPEVLLASPGTITDSLRSSGLLTALIPELERRASKLKGKLEEQEQLQAESARERITLDHARLVLLSERETIQRLLGERKLAQGEQDKLIRATEERSRQLQKDAEALRALIKRLTDEERGQSARVAALPKGKPPGPDHVPDHGAVVLDQQALAALPAAGNVIRLFGQTTENGLPARGVSLETGPLAQVIAPADGKVVFVGPFRGYGQLLIIAHGEEYHSLLAGFSRIDGLVGQQVLRGEPVGIMGDDENHKSVLYLELRHKGEAVNPFAWLASVGRKVNG